ncbi:DUF4189 domain-containing protein [Nocardia sp. NEAU-G5]|uniref:DUF4189 domain-containing protein n=1 Tax=Nocardia albiluteola TaxID=2842303 RepID=A0ABS6BEP5_9NOCA|nr:DUF4189 domain-containing protein [Nocardia albiluteola]MBU3067900.1 DUF4189 domain-containing protein [Nocardia albiluteola]
MSLLRKATVGLVVASTAGLSVAGAGAANANPNAYGAFSLSESAGTVAYALNYANYPDAIHAADAKCGHPDCHNIIQIVNACGAVAQGADGRYSWNWSASKTEAEQSAVKSLGMSAPPFPDLGSASPRAAHVVLSGCTDNV